MTIVKPAEEILVREMATATRLGRFRGTMGDADFAMLVKDAVRFRDKSDGRSAVTAFDTFAGSLRLTDGPR